MKIAKIVAGALSSLMALVAVVFASMPCIGPIYEPEVPEELRKSLIGELGYLRERRMIYSVSAAQRSIRMKAKRYFFEKQSIHYFTTRKEITMKKSTRFISALVAMVIAMSLCIPAFATSKSFVWGTAFDLQERFGSNNTTAQVKTLQRVLEQFYYDDFLGSSFVDGGFGPATETKVKEFQTRYGLTADGRVGSSTWNKMQDRIGVATTSSTLSKYFVKNRLVLGVVRSLSYTTTHYTYYEYDDLGRVIAAYYVYTDIYFKYYSGSMSWYILSAPDGMSSSTSTLIN